MGKVSCAHEHKFEEIHSEEAKVLPHHDLPINMPIMAIVCLVLDMTCVDCNFASFPRKGVQFVRRGVMSSEKSLVECCFNEPTKIQGDLPFSSGARSISS